MLISVILMSPGSILSQAANPLLKQELIDNFDIDEVKYGLWITVASICLIPCDLFGGLIIDRIGHKNSSLIFTFLSCIG